MHEGLLRLASELGISRLKLSGEDLEVEFFRRSPPDPVELTDEEGPTLKESKIPIGASYLSSDDQRTLLDPYHDINS